VSDNADNTRNASSAPVKIDTTAPATSASTLPAWNNSSVTVTLTATDNLSGVDYTQYIVDGGAVETGTSVLLSDEGVHTIDFRSVDNAGNVAASTGEIEVVHDEGDVNAIKGRRFETRISRPYLSHGSIGPSAAVALWQDDRLRVWSQSQGAYPLRAALSIVFDLPENKIEVMHRPGAGCYGHNGADDVALDAVLLARAVPGRPVKVVWSRADEFRYAPLGPGMSVSAKAVVGDDGRIAAMDVLANSAPHGNRPGRNGAPNLRASAYLEKPFPVPRSADIPAANGGGADRNSVPYYTIPNRRSAKRLVHDPKHLCAQRRAESLDGQCGHGPGRQHRPRVHTRQRDREAVHQLRRPRGRRSAEHARPRQQHQSRGGVAVDHIVAVGGLQHDGRGPGGRLHLLVHERVSSGERHLQLEHPGGVV
jgi:hypothetical protein